MKRAIVLLSVLVLAALSLTALGASGAASPAAAVAPSGTPLAPAAAPEGDQSLVPLVRRPGNYSAFDYLGVDPYRYAVTGGLVVFNWSDVEVQQDVYDWTAIDNWVALQDSVGKASIIGISTYNGRCCGGINALPVYLRDNPNAVWSSYLGHQIPRYWRDEFLQPYQRFINALGARYKDDPRVEAIAIGLGMYGELAAWKYDTDGAAAAELGEVDVWVWMDAAKKMIDYYKAAFSDSQGRLKKLLFAQTASFTYNTSERRIIAEYAVSKGLGLSINGLYPDSENMIRGDTGGDNRYTGMFDQLTRYDAAGQDDGTGLPVPSAFETYDYMIGCDGGVSVYWAILNGLDKHPQYFRLHVDLLAEPGADDYTALPLGPDKATNLDVFRWAEPYLGASVDNTPSVWVAMRDARAPWQTCWQANLEGTPYQDEFYPEYGNYDFWLYQIDNISGGQTVVETNTCTTYSGIALVKPACNPGLPAGREGWVIRRTNEPGNPYMYFNVDNGYIYGGTNAVTISVTYWDNAADTWSLHYDSVSGVKAATPLGSSNAWVQKSGSNTYKTVVFEISDARFANGIREGRADFYIDSKGDGNEWIHFVDVTNGDFAPIWELPTPTTTATPTPTNTPTITPTPRPDTGRVFGLIFDDLNENGVYNAGEPPVSDALIELLKNGTTLVRSQVTGSDGKYSFADVEPGPYLIRETDPPGYRSTSLNEIFWTISGGTVLEWNFADRQLATPTPTQTPTATPTRTATPTGEAERLELYLPLAIKAS
jgi:hypothetical protein